MEVLGVDNVWSNITNINSLSKESPVNFNHIGVSECKQMCRDLDFHIVQEYLRLNNLWEFGDEFPWKVNG